MNKSSALDMVVYLIKSFNLSGKEISKKFKVTNHFQSSREVKNNKGREVYKFVLSTGKTRFKTSQIIKGIGWEEADVANGLQALKKVGLMDNPKRGIWVIK